VQKIEQNNNGGINLVGDGNTITINNNNHHTYNIDDNTLKDTLNDDEIIEIDSSNPSIALITSLDLISALSDIPPLKTVDINILLLLFTFYP
jgi:hypothetical protein